LRFNDAEVLEDKGKVTDKALEDMEEVQENEL
jgi:hypothetical protein